MQEVTVCDLYSIIITTSVRFDLNDRLRDEDPSGKDAMVRTHTYKSLNEFDLKSPRRQIRRKKNHSP